MYFKGKNNTNIDSEFNNNIDNSIFMFILNKYKYIIIIFVILLLFIIISLLFMKNGGMNNRYLILDGEEEIIIYKDSDYVEPGYNAYNFKDMDLTSEVIIKSTLDTSVVGEYEISYKIGRVTKTRKIVVVEKPKVYTYIRLNTIDNNVNIYLKLGEEYTDPGYKVYSSTGENLNDKVKITGVVDSSKKGNYKITYSLVDSEGVTISTSRIVTVMDTEINLSLNTSEYTNSDVTINVRVDDEFFDYMILPDNSKITKNMYSYKVSKNGTYTFRAYSSKGMKKEQSITVNNINKTNPTGSCSGSFENGVSIINVVAKDDIGIKKYEINGSSYTNSKITINKELSSVTVKIYDKAGNTKDISCSLEDKNKPILFGNDIKLNYQYIDDGKYMTHALYSPNIDNKNKKIPLIVWLHEGGRTFKSNETFFKSRGMLHILDNWKLEGFNAYVVCPHMTGKWYFGTWVTEQSASSLFDLIDMFVQKYNVDTKKIILVGHSQGARGVLFAAGKRTDFFSAITVMSGFDPVNDITALKRIPAKGYSEGFEFMKTTFVSVFGKENYIEFNTDHNNIPNMAFNEDKNNDGRSDLIEWMLTQELK